jgi:hypothetical protein
VILFLGSFFTHHTNLPLSALAYFLLVQFIFNAWVCKHIEVLQTLLTVSYQFFATFWIRSWLINWAIWAWIYISGVSYSSFYILHRFRSLTLDKFLIRTFWFLLSFFVWFPLWSFFFIVFAGFASLKILVFYWCFQIFLLLYFLSCLPFFIFLTVITSLSQ